MLMLAAATLTASADVANIDIPRPESFDRNECKKALSNASECNKGAEPFKVFIKKLVSDKAFQDERIKLARDEESRFSAISFAYDRKGTLSFETFEQKNDTEEGFATWYGVSADRVCYMWNSEYFEKNDDGEKEYMGGSSMFVFFERIDGKWYLTDGYIFG